MPRHFDRNNITHLNNDRFLWLKYSDDDDVDVVSENHFYELGKLLEFCVFVFKSRRRFRSQISTEGIFMFVEESPKRERERQVKWMFQTFKPMRYCKNAETFRMPL